MAISYKKLWMMLIDKDMKKKDLCVAAGISHASMAKLGKNEKEHSYKKMHHTGVTSSFSVWGIEKAVCDC